MFFLMILQTFTRSDRLLWNYLLQILKKIQVLIYVLDVGTEHSKVIAKETISNKNILERVRVFSTMSQTPK